MGPVIIEFIGGGTLPDQGARSGPAFGEEWLLEPFPQPALERFRKLLLDRVTSDPSKYAANRVLAQLAYQTDIRMILNGLLGARPDMERRSLGQAKALTIDSALRLLRNDVPAALQELGALGAPQQHRELLEEHLSSNSFSHRVSAACCMVYLAALLNEEARQ